METVMAVPALAFSFALAHYNNSISLWYPGEGKKGHFYWLIDSFTFPAKSKYNLE